MRISVLASGSGGNALLVKTERSALLVDAGLSPREVRRRLRTLDVVPGWQGERLDGLLVTHEHTDHGRFAASFAKLGVPLWATAGTAAALELGGSLVEAGRRSTVGDVEVLPVGLPHDAWQPVGYVFEDKAARFGVLTDAGWDDPALARNYAGCQVLVLESNHDEMMLATGPYPEGLKRRIAGRRGHLSNRQSAALLGEIIRLGGRPHAVVLAHLSKTNNRPELARDAARRALGAEPHLLVARAGAPTPWITLTSEGDVEIGRRQLGFAFNRDAEGVG